MTSAYVPQEGPEEQVTPRERAVRVAVLLVIAVGVAVLAIG